MAKSKRSAALFEVIQSSRLPKQKRSFLPALNWLSRRSFKPAPFQVEVPTPIVPSVPPAAAAPDPDVDLLPAPVEAPCFPTSSPRQPIPGVDLQLDPDRQQIMFKVSYNSAIVTGFTILVAIGLAYVVGRKMSRGPIAATASPSSAELRAQPAHPEVLDIASGAGLTRAELITPSGDSAQLAAGKSPTTAPASVDTQRIIGRQYVVIQIYPDKKNALDAAALLNKNNIPCTVENGLAGWANKSWWCVIGTTGFDHIRGNAEYARYETAVNRVSEQFAANSKFKKFEPRAYRWKESTT
jgi:hypothetical protein